MDLDTHSVIFEDLNLIELKGKIDSELIKMGLDYQYRISRVLESKNKPVPYIILTSDSTTFKELEETHNNFCLLFENLKIDTLVESEHNYEIDKLYKKLFKASTKNGKNIYLENLKRKSMSELHWGDIHLDIPINSETKSIRDKFSDLGFSYIVTSKNGNDKAVITAQIIDKDLLYPIIELMCSVIKQESFKVDSFIIKAEKLVHFDGTFNAIPLPVTVGIKNN